MIGHRGLVNAWECDHYGHMNVQFYFRALNDSAFHLMAHLGLDRQAAVERRLGLPVVRMECDFRAECRVGDLLEVRSTVAEVRPKGLVLRHRLLRGLECTLALETLAITVCMDLDARRAVALPDEIAAAARQIAQANVDGDMASAAPSA